MAFIPTPNTVRVSFQFTWASQIVEITIAVTKAAPWDAADITTTLGDLKDWFDAELRPYLSNQIALVNLTGTSQESSSAPSIDLPITPPMSGGAGDPSTANNVTLVTSFLTALRGRSYRGRVYTPGLPQSDLGTSTTFLTAAATAMTAAYAAINAALTVAGAAHTVISTRTAGAPRVTGVATPVTSYRTETFADSQRRRLAGRGM